MNRAPAGRTIAVVTPILILALATSIATRAATPSASRGTPGAWTRIGSVGLPNTHEVGMARTSDGLLHVVWQEDPANSPNDASLSHGTIAADGTLTILAGPVSGFGFIDNSPDLIASGGGIEAYWGGVQNDDGLFVASSTDGISWNALARIADPQGPEFGPVSVTQGAGGITYQASMGKVHRGSSFSDPIQDYMAGFPDCTTCTFYNSAIVTDAVSGEIWHAWYGAKNAQQEPNEPGQGIYAQQVDAATGAPVGAPQQMPGSVRMFMGREASINPLDRVSLAAHPSGGLYVLFGSGYPSVDRVSLWRIGLEDSSRIASSQYMNGHVALAPTDDGRMWAAVAGRAPDRATPPVRAHQ